MHNSKDSVVFGSAEALRVTWGKLQDNFRGLDGICESRAVAGDT